MLLFSIWDINQHVLLKSRGHKEISDRLYDRIKKLQV